MPTPLPVIADTFRCALNWTGNGLTAANVLHIRKAASDSQDAFQALNGAVVASMWDTTRSTFSVDSVSVIPLDGALGTSVFSTGRPAKWSGVQAAGDFLLAASPLVKLTTGLRGPAHRGRVFVPYPAESAIQNGFLSTGNRNTMQAGWEAFHSALITAGWDWVVASYVHAEAASIDNLLVESALATQRRRQGRIR